MIVTCVFFCSSQTSLRLAVRVEPLETNQQGFKEKGETP